MQPARLKSGGSNSMASISSISRREFARALGVAAACGVVQRTALPGASLHAAESGFHFKPASVVRLNSNENPYGPSPLALTAMSAAFALAWRYPDEQADALVEQLA